MNFIKILKFLKLYFQIQNGNSDYLKWINDVVPPLDKNA